MGSKMTGFIYHIGGRFIRTLREWMYVGGIEFEDAVDADVVSFFTILESCGELGFTNIKKLWYVEHRPGRGLRENLKVLDGDNTFGVFINYALDNDVVNIYIEHGSLMHPYFGGENPKTMCSRLGISEHGRKVGGESVQGGSSKDKCVIEEGEFDVYDTENERDHTGAEYWDDCPYLSAEEDEELINCREKKMSFHSRSGPSGVAGPDLRGPTEAGSPSDPNGQIGNSDEFVEEITREMNKRDRGSPNTGPVELENNEVCFNSDSEGSFLSSSSDSEEEEARRIPYRRPRFQKGETFPQFSLCMVFPNKSEFKKAVERHAILLRRDVRFKQNDGIRCRAVCTNNDCNWKILCSIDGRSGQWMVKTLVANHTCPKLFHISCLSYKTLAEWFISYLKKVSLKMTVAELKDHFTSQTKIKVSRSQCIHAREKVVNHYIGDPLKEFARLEDYVEELKKSNPGSTIVMEEEGGVFKRMYVCFAGVRKGFNEACRKIIGLDGCFLKGPFKGEILSAVGRDPNDQIYPIAWAVVGYECKETWKWFLELLMADLGVAGGDFVYAGDGAPVISRGEGFTFISDQQKGLILAITELMPAAVHRRCARHIFAKWRKDYSSDELHRQFWKTCKSSTQSDFLDELEVLKGMSPNAMTDFLEISPTHWCRAFQNTSSCCDVVDNNMSETFNCMILESRYKSIIKLFETIRKIVFKRFKERKSFLNRFKDGLGPKIWNKLNHNREMSGKFYVDSNGDDGYEVHLDEETCWVVSLEKLTCTCRKWQLNGLPCEHAFCVLETEVNNADITTYVSKWYGKQMFELAYKYPILPVQGMKFWPRVAVTKIIPPSFKKFPGRPKKVRRREGWEPANCGTKMSQKGRKMSCSICKIVGHKSTTCKNNPSNQNAGQPSIPPHGEPVEEPSITSMKTKRKMQCSLCKKEGHNKSTCKKRSANASSSQDVLPPPAQMQPTPMSASQVSGSQVKDSQASDRTQTLLQQLRQECGTSQPTVGRKKKLKKTSKLPEGLGCFVAESGWTCYNPNTPQARVINVPAKRKRSVDTAVRGVEDQQSTFRAESGALGSIWVPTSK